MGRKRGLQRRDVVAAAAELADRGGLDAVTLAAVAAALGVRSPSLYAHVEGLPGLRRRLALYAAREMGGVLRAAAEGQRGQEAVRAIAHAYRGFARRHPGRYAAVQRAVASGEDDELYAELARAVTPALTALEEAGVVAADRVHLARAFRSALHGFVVLEQGGGFGMPESVDESFGRLVELLITGVRAASADGWARQRIGGAAR